MAHSETYLYNAILNWITFIYVLLNSKYDGSIRCNNGLFSSVVKSTSKASLNDGKFSTLVNFSVVSFTRFFPNLGTSL